MEFMIYFYIFIKRVFGIFRAILSRIKRIFIYIFVCFFSDPDKWGTIYPTCNGNQQSPIDIETKDVEYDKGLHRFHFKKVKKLDGVKMTLVNNGHAGLLFIHEYIVLRYTLITANIRKGPSWSGSCGFSIYNFLYNQCISPLKLWAWIPIKTRCTRYNIMW